MFLCYHVKLTTKDTKFTKFFSLATDYSIFLLLTLFLRVLFIFVVNNVLFLSDKVHREGREIHEVKDKRQLLLYLFPNLRALLKLRGELSSSNSWLFRLKTPFL